jgi:DNA ligase D-like protein (predicted ligase)
MPRSEQDRLRDLPKKQAAFVEPMECAFVTKLYEGPQWLYEIKLDGYRAIAVKSEGKVSLFSRRRKSFNRQFPAVVEALRDLPDGTVVDGEIVALDDSGRPAFYLLQHFRGAVERIRYFIFDLLCYKNRDLTSLPLIERRTLMGLLPPLRSHICVSEYIQASATDILQGIREQGLEGIVAKRKNSLYESGKRSGSWIKYRVNRAQELVIGGFIPGPHGVDSLIVGYYRGKDLVYVARVRAGFVPATRRKVFEKLGGLRQPDCPFVNLPDKRPSRWGENLTAEKMKKCIWVRPELVAQIEFLEWTEGDRLRHSRFVGLRDDKKPRQVVKEHSSESS